MKLDWDTLDGNDAARDLAIKLIEGIDYTIGACEAYELILRGMNPVYAKEIKEFVGEIQRLRMDMVIEDSHRR